MNRKNRTCYKLLYKALEMPWFKIAWEVWVPLSLGYMWVVGSYILPLEPVVKQASGSILVAASIIAQLLYDGLEWRKELSHLKPGTHLNLTGNGNYNYQEGNCNVSSPVTVTVSSADKNPSMHDFVVAYFRSRESRFSLLIEIGKGDTNANKEWFFQRTKRRVEYWVAVNLALSVLVGTVIWGYGISIYFLAVCAIAIFMAYVNRPLHFCS